MTEMPVAPIEHAELPEGRYSDRELSWLAFNNRVLDLAKDSLRPAGARQVPIFSSNLDEFYMVRAAGLKRRIDAGVAVLSNAGIRPRDPHDAILTRTAELVAEQAREVFSEDVRPAFLRRRASASSAGTSWPRPTKYCMRTSCSASAFLPVLDAAGA